VRQRFVRPFFQPTRPHFTLAAGSKEKKTSWANGGSIQTQLGGNSHTCDIDWEVHALFFLYAYGKNNP
jgi:hypothetical protein